MKTEKLKVSTYATRIGKSVQSVYDMIEKNKIKSEKIDGVQFVIIETK